MKKIKRIVKAVGALSFMGCAVMAPHFALAADDAGWIGGLSVGQSVANIDDTEMRAQLARTGLRTPLWDTSDHSTAFKIFAGYKFNNNFALEGGYFDLGRFGITMTTVPAGTRSANISLRGLNLDAVGMLPFTEKFSGLGRIGLNYAQARDGFSSTGAVVNPMNSSPEENAFNLKVGLGLQYDFTEDVGMRGEWERYRISDAVGSRGDINMYSLGLVVKFGEKPAPVRKAAAPMPLAAPAPQLCIVPVVAKTQKYCSILDIQFEINEEDIQREEKERLAVLGDYMTKYPDTTAVIEGHSDNVGSSEDNMKLSKQRADSVVSYLVNELHIANTRLTAVGYGDTRPVADNRTEEGKRQNRRIDAVIACVTDIEGLKVKPARLTMAMELEFDQNKADIKPVYASELSRVAKYLKANPSVSATVEGHADNLKATPEQSMKISHLRAQNVANYLVENLGVPRSQVTAASFGENRRFAYNTSVEGAQENRRVNIILNYPKQ